MTGNRSKVRTFWVCRGKSSGPEVKAGHLPDLIKAQCRHPPNRSRCSSLQELMSAEGSSVSGTVLHATCITLSSSPQPTRPSSPPSVRTPETLGVGRRWTHNSGGHQGYRVLRQGQPQTMPTSRGCSGHSPDPAAWLVFLPPSSAGT